MQLNYPTLYKKVYARSAFVLRIFQVLHAFFTE